MPKNRLISDKEIKNYIPNNLSRSQIKRVKKAILSADKDKQFLVRDNEELNYLTTTAEKWSASLRKMTKGVKER